MKTWLRTGLKHGTQAIVIGLVTVALLEAILLFSFRYPTLSPIPKPVLQHLHVLFVRNTIQVLPACAQYDDTLTYTLRPGTCVFSNTEYSNEYSINSLGLRDTEAALHQPETIVLGDSIAMGWGVEQHEAFPKVYERITGSRTLNAAISSYGTARELMLLERLDRSALKHLIIQYHENDFAENKQFASGEWRTLDREQYEATVRKHAEMQRYFPGKHAINMLVLLRNAVADASAAGANSAAARRSWEEEAEIFLQVLALSPVELTAYDITVIALETEFIEAARSLAARSSLPPILGLRFVDAGFLYDVPGAFYVLDDHPTAAGQDAMARSISDARTTFSRN